MALDCRTSLFFKNILTDFIEYESIVHQVMQNEEKSMLCFFMRNSLFRHRLQDLLKFDGYCIHRAVFRGKLCKLLINKENNEIRRKINFFLHCWLKNDMLCTAYRSGTPASAPSSATITQKQIYRSSL